MSSIIISISVVTLSRTSSPSPSPSPPPHTHPLCLSSILLSTSFFSPLSSVQITPLLSFSPLLLRYPAAFLSLPKQISPSRFPLPVSVEVFSSPFASRFSFSPPFFLSSPLSSPHLTSPHILSHSIFIIEISYILHTIVYFTFQPTCQYLRCTFTQPVRKQSSGGACTHTLQCLLFP